MSGVFEQRLHLTSSDSDMWRRLRPGVLARLLQEAAIAHTEELGAGRDKTLDRGLLWIVTRMSCEVTRMPEYGEDVILRSWPGDMMHVLFPRYFELTDGAGQVLLRVSSLWLLIDAASRGMAFPKKYGISVAGCPGESGLPLPDRSLSFPASLPDEAERVVRYSETDLNGHLNNTRYLDWAEDLTDPAYHREHPLRSFWVEYRSEMRCGERAKLRSAIVNNVLWLRGEADGRETFKMRLEYDTI